MQKLTITVPSEQWGTLKTKYPADTNRVDAAEFTAGTKNVQTSVNGSITKRLGGIVYSSLGSAPKDQYEAIFSDGVHHLLTVNSGDLKYTTGDGVEHTALSGLTSTLYNEFVLIQDRVYFSNGVVAKVYDRTTSYGGVSYTFPTDTIKDIGCQVPQSAPTFASDTSGGSVPVGGHHYKVTFVYYGSEESNGSPATALHTVSGSNNTVHLTAIPVGGYGVTARNLYRDNGDAVYTLIGAINDNTTTTFTDSSLAGLTPLPLTNDIPPSYTISAFWKKSLWIGGISGDPSNGRFSNPFLPDVFDPANSIDFNPADPMTAYKVYLDRLIVFNRRSMGQILGNTPDTFEYNEIDPSIGCVDLRSIQIRTINGIPMLIWLSDKGIYGFDGSNVVYLSDPIEDQINFNIQQVAVQKNKITQSSLTDFQQGTSSDGVNLLTSPGDIENKGPFWDTATYPTATIDEQTDPTITFDSDSDWDGGSDVENAATKDGLNTLKDVHPFTPSLASGALSGDAYIVGSNLQLHTFGGESNTAASSPDTQPLAVSGAGTVSAAGQPIKVSRNGTITSLSVKFNESSSTSRRVKIQFYSGTVTPTTQLFSSGTITLGSGITVSTQSVSIAVTTGTQYWIVASVVGLTDPSFASVSETTTLAFSGMTSHARLFNGGSWVITTSTNSYQMAYALTPAATSGSWISPIFDSLSQTIQALTINAGSTSFPATTAGTLLLKATNDATFASGISTYTLSSPTGGDSGFPYTNLRFYRFEWDLTASNGSATPVVPAPQISAFPGCIWASQVIDCTADVVSYDSLAVVQTGAAITLTIATSDDGSTFSGFTDISMATVKQYVKVQVETAGLTSIVSSVTFYWTVASTFISEALDTGITPSGWDIFQADYQANGGTIVYYMRSAASSGALSGASWYTVTNGAFPTPSLPVLQWVQYKAVITSHRNQLPIIHSITLNWFIGNNSTIRTASLFFNKSYYLAAAEFGQTHNNIVFELDFENKWRVHKDINIATLSYFFNSPYYGDSSTGEVVAFLQGLQDKGQAIALDVFTKAFEFSTQYVDNDDKIKILDEVLLHVGNTGATYSVLFSTDYGATWNPLYNQNGNSTWVVPSDTKMSFIRLRPNYETDVQSGRTIMLNIHNSDSMPALIQTFKVTAIVRKQRATITG